MKAFWIINLALFQLSWFVAAKYTDYAAWIIAAAIFIHFACSPSKQDDLKLVMLVPIGIAIDQLMLSVGVFSAASYSVFPLWLALLWYMFILTLNHSLKWLTQLPLSYVAVIGAIAGSFTYWLGTQVGGLTQQWPLLPFVAILAVAWSALMPVLVGCHRMLITAVKPVPVNHI
ncbi:DUF2878 domain-containing protein [Shewanella waksmanii]|uniref:DUF2878 domain-containing protein n=1 Tax=Shewanella waksmanii TaxID=213783 RepID=UPI00373695A8